jgi:Fur family zinc uptake transcriptional regulator
MSAFDNAATSFAGAHHDHGACVSSALGTAARLCGQRSARLTPLRRRVLELIWRGHAPVRAYDLLARLAAKNQRPAAPPTVYRALEFLLAQGLIHRIESLNAYVGCMNPEGHSEGAHSGQFLICGDCGAAAEVHDPRVDAAVARRARELGFAVRRKTIEVEGLCPTCQRYEKSGQRRAHAG